MGTCYRRKMSLPEAAETLGLVRPDGQDTPERAGRRLLRALLAAEQRDGRCYLAWRGPGTKVAREPGKRGAKGVRLSVTEVLLREALPECFFARDREAELLAKWVSRFDSSLSAYGARLACAENAIVKIGELAANILGQLTQLKQKVGRRHAV